MRIESSLRSYGMRTRYNNVSIGRAKRIMKNTAKRHGLKFDRVEMEVWGKTFDMFYHKRKRMLCLIEDFN